MNRERIEEVLIKMGMPAHLKGLTYITDAVEYIEENGEDIRITKELYPEIAKNRDTTAPRVERAIRHAFSAVRGERGNREMVEKYIGFKNHENSPSIIMLYKMTKKEMGEETERSKECKERETGERIDLESKVREIVRQELKMALSELEGLQV